VKKVRNHSRHPTCSVSFLFTSAYNNTSCRRCFLKPITKL
jgi:hypothetical protein